MRNQELAKIFYEIADYLEMEGVAFKPYAYQKAALALETLEEDVWDLYHKGGMKALEDIPGVGKSIAEKIEEYLKTGTIKYYKDLKKKMPFHLEELISVEGLGPKKAKLLYEKLGIRNLQDLEKAAKAHKIAPLFGFGEKTERNILQGIEFVKRSHGRFLLGEILPVAREIEAQLRSLKWVTRVDIAGSLRRRKETIGDVDFLVISDNPARVMDFFVQLPGVIKVWGKGNTKASVRMKEGFDMDIRVLPAKSYGAALQYFTGSKEHNIATRKLAIEKGLKLSEYGLFRGKKMIAAEREEDIYKMLGLPLIPPELRENRGEIEAAIKGQLPTLLEYNDMKGDLHVHSNWDGGADSIEELAKTAMAMGYEYIGISDHTKFLRIEHGLNENQLEKRNREIDKINETLKLKNSQFRILKGCEANIMSDGSIDISNRALAELDYVIAGVHSHLKMPKEQMTKRIITAMRNPHVDIIAHPTGRILKKRDEYQIDFDKILKAAKETGTVLEIDAYPERLDLNDINIRRAKEMGVKMVINSDTHRKDQLRYMEFGVAQARRGWAEKGDIINAWPREKLTALFRK
jgi:DNA polymerase (family 10)